MFWIWIFSLKRREFLLNFNPRGLLIGHRFNDSSECRTMMHSLSSVHEFKSTGGGKKKSKIEITRCDGYTTTRYLFRNCSSLNFAGTLRAIPLLPPCHVERSIFLPKTHTTFVGSWRSEKIIIFLFDVFSLPETRKRIAQNPIRHRSRMYNPKIRRLRHRAVMCIV